MGTSSDSSCAASRWSGSQAARALLVFYPSPMPPVIWLLYHGSVTPTSERTPVASYYDAITPEQAALIAAAPLFFVATATSCGYGVPVMAPVAERTLAARGRRYKEAR